MTGKPSGLSIFLTAGAITAVTVVGVTLVFPPSEDSELFTARGGPIVIDVQDRHYEPPEIPPTIRSPDYRFIIGEPPPSPESLCLLTLYDEPPVLIKKCRPRYPADAKKHRIEADVLLVLFIDRRGAITYVRAESYLGYKSLEKEAIRAALNCEFRPATKDGQPVGVWHSMVMEFRL